MTLDARIAMAQRLEERYRAERIGLVQAKIGTPLSPEMFATDHERAGFACGYSEGCAILLVEKETRACS